MNIASATDTQLSREAWEQCVDGEGVDAFQDSTNSSMNGLDSCITVDMECEKINK